MEGVDQASGWSNRMGDTQTRVRGVESRERPAGLGGGAGVEGRPGT